MIGGLFAALAVLRLTALQQECTTFDDAYYEFPKFWTNVGFCPAGGINQKEISESLNSVGMEMNLRYIGSLPNGAVKNIRIHWLLELMKFLQFTQNGVPIYEFDDLDTFMEKLNNFELNPVIEFMANPGHIFEKNPMQNGFYWEDLVFQVVKHYLNMYGAAKVAQWKFEAWNEPDLNVYNLLNFTGEDYLNYVQAIRRGLTEVGRRPKNSLNFQLRGPAGLFKNEEKHPLCWGIVEYCNRNLSQCPFDVLTFHRKGAGHSEEVLVGASELINKIHKLYPNLKKIPIANDEADPRSNWAAPLKEYSDVRYANTLVRIILEHWDAKLRNKNFENFESLSHDNAFLSYHPYEFEQRTLLAHFQMNNSNPPYSQFIKKPVYSALGLLAKLGPLAAETEVIKDKNGTELRLLKTSSQPGKPLYINWLFVSEEDEREPPIYSSFIRKLHYKHCLGQDEKVAFIAEKLEQQETNPYLVWSHYNYPSFPNSIVRHEMRLQEVPIIHYNVHMNKSYLNIDLKELRTPWILSLRACSNLKENLKQPLNLEVNSITKGEVLLTWKETPNSTDCLRTYEIWFQAAKQPWNQISSDRHIPFPSFHFAPFNLHVNGFYKVRGIDVFNRTSPFSEATEYYEI